jgi:hypothetical protein
MQPVAKAFAAQAAGLLLWASLGNAHDHGDIDSMEMSTPSMASARPIIATSSAAAASHTPETYFRYEGSAGLMYAHIVLMIMAWMFVLPFGECWRFTPQLGNTDSDQLGVMFSIARSRLTIPCQMAFLIINALGLFVGTIYNSKTPDFYPGNSHHKLGWAVTWIFGAQVFLGVINMYAGHRKSDVESSEEMESFIPVSTQALAEHHNHMKTQARANRIDRYSYDSGQGTERASSSFQSQSASPLEEHPPSDFGLELSMNDITKEGGVSGGSRGLFSHIDTFLAGRVPAVSSRLSSTLELLYETLNRSILLLGFVVLTTGAVTYSGIFVRTSSTRKT